MSLKTIISTRECYEGFNNDTDCWEGGSYSELSENTEIDANTIEWSNHLWDAEKIHFNDILEFEKNKYEKRYKTEVLELVLCGRVGRWSGSPIGGKVVNFNNPLDMGNVDDIDATLEEDRTIFINGHHHDGSHHMALYFLTESAMKRAGIFGTYEYYGTDGFTADDFESIYNNLNPVKLSKNNEYCSL